MIKKINNQGAATLVTSIIISSVVFAIILATTIISIDQRSIIRSHLDSAQAFYAAQAGVTEALYQLRKDPNTFILPDFKVGDIWTSPLIYQNTTTCGNTCFEATASTTHATRKVRYSCDQDISNCDWVELIP